MTLTHPPTSLLPSAAQAAAEEGSGSASGVAVVLAVAAALIAALVLAEVLAAVVRAIGHRSWFAQNLSRRSRRPLRVVLLVAAVWIAVRLVTEPPPAGPTWLPVTEHVLLIAMIIGLAWLIGSLAFVAEDAAVARYRTDVPDNRHARRVRTQVMVLRRITVAVLVVCAVAGVLLTFDAARVAGAGLLASAGLVSVVVGLAAQTALANVFAGLQLAFTDAIRVDDVVVVDDEWGRVEEITMTYVVVHLWDDRRLIMPSTWFTTTPFENWTRRAADLLGTVELDLDWAVPVTEMRAELTRVLHASDLWDHRVGVLQVTEATGGLVRVRGLARAADPPHKIDHPSQVVDSHVAWVHPAHPEALPRTRLEQLPHVDGAGPAPAVHRATGDQPTTAVAEPATTATVATVEQPPTGETPTRRRRTAGPDDTMRLDVDRDARLFTGSLQAVERSKAFAGPGEEAIAEREHTAEGPTVEPEPRRHPQ